MSVKYAIRVEKNGANVTAWYDVRVRRGRGATVRIASFELRVEGKNLIDQFLPGQKGFAGIRFHILANPSADAGVAFAITANETWSANGSDALRGEKQFDDVSFAN